MTMKNPTSNRENLGSFQNLKSRKGPGSLRGRRVLWVKLAMTTIGIYKSDTAGKNGYINEASYSE